MSHIKDRRRYNRGWVAVITKPNGGGEDHSRSFPTKKEAEDYVTEQDGHKLKGRFVSPAKGQVTFGERWEIYWSGVVHLRPSSKARDLSYVRNLILPHIGSIALRDIDHDVLQAWVATLTNRGYAAATVVKAHGIVSKTLDDAIAQKLIASNPCVSTQLPTVVVNEQMFLKLEDVDELVHAIDLRFALPTMVASMTGLRAGELFGMQVRDIDPRDNWLKIRRSVIEVDGHVEHREYLKTYAGRREVPLPAIIMEEVEEHIEGKAPTDLVFTAPKGGTVRLATWRRRYWRPAACAVGQGHMIRCTAFDGEGRRDRCELCTRPPMRPRGPHFVGLRLHDLRHTAVSLWIEEGRHMFHITKFLGQTNSSLVDKRYGHLVPKQHDAAQDRLNRRLEDIRRRRNGVNVTELRQRRSS
jgi:integrase